MHSATKIGPLQHTVTKTQQGCIGWPSSHDYVGMTKTELHSQNPSADIAITHDNDWRFVMKEVRSTTLSLALL